MTKEMIVSLYVNDDQLERLERIRQVWQEKPGSDGSYPFKNYTLEKMLEVVMLVGSKYTIDRHLDTMEEMYGIGKDETPAAGTAGGSR